MYTKVINRGGKFALSYRDHFVFGQNITVTLKNSQELLIIGDTVSNRYVSFASDDFEVIVNLHQLIKSFYDPRNSSDSAFAEGSEMALEVPNDDDEIVVNESMADEDWIVTDIDMIKACEEDDDDDINDDCDFWIPHQFLKSIGMSKGKKKVVEESKSRFYVASPDYN